MKWIDIKAGFKDFWNEFKNVKFGLFGLILLFIFILAVFLNPYIVPFPEASSRWRDITYWEDNPVSAPPVWVNWFSSTKRAPSLIIREHTFSEEKMRKMKLTRTIFEYEYSYDLPPLDVIFHGYAKGSPVIMLNIERPDGRIVELVRRPISKSDGKIVRISIAKDTRIESYNFGAKYESPEQNRIIREMVKPTSILFSEAKEGILVHPTPLKGAYKIIAEIILPSETDVVEDVYLSLSGSVSGWLGTDNSKRDIWSGVVAGVKWALLIGLLTAFTAVSIGVIYGVMSAYLGGWRDSLMQRIFELFVGIPLLPVLIVMSAIFKPSIWILIIMMSCFFWVGPVKTVRSMGLQIKEETYIEAARALGSSSSRIIFKHMVPLLIPYSFASMALYVPSAIVYEASISLLGLGDSTIVTWGQILHDALTGGAVINGLWWWVIPPGLFIALMGMTFAFIGFAMDKILHPKLRTR
ncbi:MAG TPA: ABC transporter permease [Candidatus Atribacteria bacterium]|nr:ABC transporter permease [Candidatus Atribacteria bacterium]